jgi:hypothetical protein
MRLYLVDLSASSRARRLLRWRALASLRRSSEPACVLVHDPLGGSLVDTWPAHAQLVQPSALLDPEDTQRINTWAYDVSMELVQGRGRGLFPTWKGVHFGELLLTVLQDHLVGYASLLVALQAAATRCGARSCRIFSTERSLACALARETMALVPNSRPVVLARPGLPDGLGHLVTRLRARSRSELALREPRRAAQLAAELESVAEPSRHPQVLVISESVPMAQMFDSVEAALRRSGVGPLLRLQYSIKPGDDAGFRTPETICFERPDSATPEFRGRYRSAWEEICPRVREAEASWGLGWGGGPLPLESFMRRQYSGRFDNMAEHVDFVTRCLDATRPALVVVGNDRWWVSQAFVQVARQRGTPTLVVQDGVATATPQWGWRTADRVAASSSFFPDMLAARGVPREACVVTGQPRYDTLFVRSRQVTRADARRLLGLDPDAFWVMFATQYLQHPDYPRQVIGAVLRVPSVRLIVRPHPSQDLAEIQRVSSAFPLERISLQPDSSVFDLLSACDMLITQFSTVAIEAAVLGKPVITANFNGMPDPVPYVEHGVSTAAFNLDEITEQVAQASERWRAGRPVERQAVTDEGFERLVGPTDGLASDRVVDVVRSMLR